MINNMRKVLRQIFRPNDGSARAVQAAVRMHVLETKRSADAMMETVRELMERNDKITGRQHDVIKVQKFGK